MFANAATQAQNIFGNVKQAAMLGGTPPGMPINHNLRDQLALILSNLHNASDQMTRIEDAIDPQPMGGGPAGGTPAPNTIQQFIYAISDQTLAISVRAGRIAEAL